MKTDLSVIQRLTRLYTFYSPIRKGKYRLAQASLALEKDLPKQVVAKSVDGRILKVNFDNHFAHFIYFLGEYEPAITELIRTIVHPGDICLDIGGNIGWYTTLMQTLVGDAGQVHSFEPVPPTFEVLKENVFSNSNSNRVFLNNFALGETTGEVNIHIFDDEPDGHASISNFGKTDYTAYPVKVSTLTDYLSENGIGDIKFVKIDIEGGEISMLKGAKDLFKQAMPPILEIEMALATTSGFGYLPNDIIVFIRQQREYEFYAIDENSYRLERIEKFERDDIGANVLCWPVGHHSDLKKLLKDKIKN